jgi:glycosyltransferase involved in cell wall biosynthesis
MRQRNGDERSGEPHPAALPGVLMVTGAYYPEISGAGLQCRALVNQLRDRIAFTVLTTTADRSLPVDDVRDGVPVHRVFIDPASWWSKTTGTFRLTLAFFRNARGFSIVHLHGFSQKSMLLIWLARMKGKRVAIKLTSVGHDDPASMSQRGGPAYWLYSRADLFFAVSPRFAESYHAAGLPANRFRLIPNGVDCERFRPAVDGERERIRHELGLPVESRLVLFVGFFSREKHPDLLFEAWAKLAVPVAPDSALVFVGATQSPYYEIDKRLAERIRQLAHALGLDGRVRFVERTHEIERFHRAADIFAMPSVREGLPNALLEAMASGTACVATRLEGVTDILIEHERNGLLVPALDGLALQTAMRRCFEDREWARGLGAEARRTVQKRYDLGEASQQYLKAYLELGSATSESEVPRASGGSSASGSEPR